MFLRVGRTAGVLSLDEAIQMANVVTGGNDKALLLTLEPQYHSSTEKHAVVKHRRLLEDKIILKLGLKTLCHVLLHVVATCCAITAF